MLKLGVVVDLLSHPVVVGFTNAGALIIATSQIGKLFGVSVEKAAHHYETVYNTVLAAVEGTHWPTFWMAVLAIQTSWLTAQSSLLVDLKLTIKLRRAQAPFYGCCFLYPS